MNNNFLRNTLSFRLFCESCVKRTIHQYRSSIPWKNSVEFVDYLIKSTIYFKNDLLVLNKPYGVSFSRGDSSLKTKQDPEKLVFKKPLRDKTSSSSIDQPFITSGVVSDSLSLTDCLPYLEKHFGVKKLFISRVPEKYVSGVAILTTSAELAEKVVKTRLHAPTGKDKYLAVVVGVPKHSEGTIKLGFQIESNPKKGKRVVLLHKWGANAYKRGEVSIGTFHFRTLSVSPDNLTALVEIAVDLRRNHAYRVFAADYLYAPLLGDNMFGSRVQTVMGTAVSVHHFSDAAAKPQTLPRELYEALGLTPADAPLIPVHIHLAEMLLPHFPHKKESLVLKATPPPHFLWTCERLRLTKPDLASIAAV